tara:strand:- start:52 stop:792 length:741 start_codon:yes stop_codon:yes gene_type:complete
MQVNYPSQINVSNIEYSEMRPFGDNAKIVYVNHNSKPIIIQTPLMVCPYGLGRYDGDTVKYSLDFSFRGKDETPAIKRFYDMLNSLDDKILEESSKNSLAWFKKKTQSKDVSEALYTPSVKVATENGEPTDKYPPTFKCSIKSYDGKFKVLSFNDEKEPIDNNLQTTLSKGQTVRGIVKLSGIWFAGGKFGTKWELQQLKFTPRVNINEYSFVDDEDDETTNNNSTEEGNTETVNENYAIDSEDDL